MDLIHRHGVSRIARIFVNENIDIGLKIASRFHYGPEVKICYYSTISQALEALLKVQLRKMTGGQLQMA